MKKTFEQIAEEIKDRTNSRFNKCKADVIYDDGEAQYIDVYAATLDATIHYINPIMRVVEYYDMSAYVTMDIKGGHMIPVLRIS